MKVKSTGYFISLSGYHLLQEKHKSVVPKVKKVKTAKKSKTVSDTDDLLVSNKNIDIKPYFYFLYQSILKYREKLSWVRPSKLFREFSSIPKRKQTRPLSRCVSPAEHLIAQTRFYRSRSLRPGQGSNQGQTMTLHTYIP